MRVVAASAVLMVLAACQVNVNVPGPVIVTSPPAYAECGAHRFQWLVGRPASELNGLHFAKPVHIVRTGHTVSGPVGFGVATRPPEPRMTIVVDQAHRISSVYCS